MTDKKAAVRDQMQGTCGDNGKNALKIFV